jgi:hypothetical protein
MDDKIIIGDYIVVLCPIQIEIELVGAGVIFLRDATGVIEGGGDGDRDGCGGEVAAIGSNVAAAEEEVRDIQWTVAGIG